MLTVMNAYTLSECLEITAEEVARREARGEKNLVFCEDRLTLVAERALTRRLGGSFLSSVTTFARFLKAEKGVLSKQGSVMAIGGIMHGLRLAGKLRCFTAEASAKNNAKPIYETVAQLAASEVTAETLRESYALLPDGMLKDKIADLAEIYGAYTEFLQRNGFVDESKYLSLLPAQLRKDEELKTVNVYFLCYSSFTAQAAETLRAAMETAKNVYGVFCYGAEELYVGAASRVFSRVAEEYGGATVRNLGAPIGGEAEVLRGGLFNPEKLTGEHMRTERIRLFEADDERDEAEYIAANIKKLIAEDETLRYRDIALLLSDARRYVLPVKRAFAEYGIPCFFDEKKSLRAHPLGRFLLDCFACVREGYAPKRVQSLAANYFFGESDEYRNYLLKYANFRGGAKREIKTGEAVASYDTAKLNACRERLLAATAGIRKKATGRAYCRAVEEILAAFSAVERLTELEDALKDASAKSFVSQIGSALERVLREAELLTGGREMTVSEFESILFDGLEATEISLIPLKNDAVFVGDITESRIEKVCYLFAAGLTDEVPGNASDTALVSDQEIEKLKEVKTLLEPTVAEVNLRTRECVALNLCTFTDGLFLSYPLAPDGSEPMKSEIFRYIDGLFCSPRGMRILPEKELSEGDFKYRCSALAPAIRELLVRKKDFENGKTDDRRAYASLYTALERLERKEQDDYLQKWEGQVRVERGDELFFRDGRISPTTLEKYFSCPFCNFAEQGLHLKEREETAVMATDSGNFIHELLEKISKEINGLETEEKARARAREICEELLEKPVYAAQSDTKSGGYSAARLTEEGIEVALAIYRHLKGSSYEVAATEMPVRTEAFRGKIDRVDTTEKFVRIVDYKTGAIDDTPLAYYTGRKLQLELYMSAVCGDKTPAGAFYFPASVSFSKAGETKFRMQGFLNGDADALAAGDNRLELSGEKSEFFDARWGDNARLEKVMDGEVFRDFLDYAVYEARQGAKELRRGIIAPSPFKGACTYCRYGGMCGFNYDLSAERTEEAIKPKTIAEIARRRREGADTEENV